MVSFTESQQRTIELLNPWWTANKLELGILRKQYLQQMDQVIKKQSQILFLLGSRRVGKTMILWQYINQLIQEGVKPNKILFLSLDNTNLEKLDLYGLLTETKYHYVFLDEIHYLFNWAQTLKSIYDLPGNKLKIIASGSSSEAIRDSKALLTGRSTNLQVLPLSYLEFGQFSQTEKNLENYLFYGGYPEYVIERNPNYLNELLRDIVEKDIIKLHRIKNSQSLILVAQILAKQVGHISSANKIAKVLDLDNKTVSNFVAYLHEVQLITPVYQFSSKLNERLYAPKKYYFQDLGMRNSLVGFVDIGAIVENAVFLKLVSKYGKENIYYGAGGRIGEIDFVVKNKRNEIKLIESKYINLQESVINKLSPLLWKMEWSGRVISRTVVTDRVTGTLEKSGVKIELVPLEDFLKS